MTLCVLCICISSKPSPRARSRFCSFKLQFTVLRLPFFFFFVSSLRFLSRRQHSSLYFLSPFVSSLIRTWGYEVTRRSISLVYVYLPTYLASTGMSLLRELSGKCEQFRSGETKAPFRDPVPPIPNTTDRRRKV